MLLFAFYAAFSWYLAAKWRRTWKGFLSQFASIALLVALIRLFVSLGRSDTDDPGRFMSIVLLLVFEVGLVGLIGLLICCVPRSAPSARHCRHCHYDLGGLAAQPGTAVVSGKGGDGANGIRCPECGRVWIGDDDRAGFIPVPTAAGGSRPADKR